MRSTRFLFVVMGCLALAVATQAAPGLEALKLLATSNADDSTRAMACLQLYDALHEEDSSAARKYLKTAIDIISSLNSQRLRAELSFRKAQNFDNVYRYDSALFYYDLAIPSFRTDGMIDALVECQFNKIRIYYNLDRYTDAIEVGHDLLKVQQARGDSLGMGKALSYIGLAYDYVDEHDTAIKFYHEALDIFITVKDKEREGGIYHNLAGVYDSEGLPEQALVYHNKALEIAKIINDQTWLSSIYVNMGLIYEKSNPKEAERLFLKGLEISRLAESTANEAFAYQNLATVNLHMGKLKKAEQYGLASLEIGTQQNNFQLIENNSQLLFEVFQAQGNYKKAILYLQKANQIRDSVYTENNARIMREMQAKYESEKRATENDLLRKESEIKESSLQRKNAIITLLAVVFLILVIGSLAFYRGNYVRQNLLDQIRKQKESAERDRELIEHQAEKLKEHDIVKSRFFANVSHDFRTPLTLIMGSLANIKADKESYITDQSEKDLDLGEKNCKRLLFLANEINELNRLDEGSLQLRLKMINAAKFVKLIVDMFSSAAESKSVSLYYESTLAGDRSIMADPDHFERIIYNLLTNALKFTPEGGRITVKTENDTSKGDNHMVIKVSDTGMGIPKKSLPYVFNRFYQSILNEYSSREGFGIGLALVKELVALHDGEITATSKENVGTTFVLKFPVVGKEAGEESPTPKFEYDSDLILTDQRRDEHVQTFHARLPEEQPTTNRKVLIVEDHYEVREYIDRIVRKTYVTHQAPNGKVALEILEREEVDLVVTDLMMPWMDGFELLQAMKSSDRLKKIPVMVISAKTNDEDKDKVLKLGVNDFLIKPFKAEELLTRIENLIQNKDQWNEELGTLFINNEGRLQQFEKDLLKKVEEHIIRNISNSRFSVLDLAEEMAASERQVYRMIKKLSGMTPYEYIKEVRWQYAEYLLKNHKVQSVSEAAKNIGMSNVTDFKRQFSKRFNKLPSEYIS